MNETTGLVFLGLVCWALSLAVVVQEMRIRTLRGGAGASADQSKSGSTPLDQHQDGPLPAPSEIDEARKRAEDEKKLQSYHSTWDVRCRAEKILRERAKRKATAAQGAA